MSQSLLAWVARAASFIVMIVVCNDNLITWVPSVWDLYVWLALVPIIGVIFGRIKDRSEKDLFFNLARIS